MMVITRTAEIIMQNPEHEDRPLKLVDGNTNEKNLVVHKFCTELTACFRRFTSGAERSLRPGMLAQWKPGMKNRNTPEYGIPMVVMEILAMPVVDTTFDSGSVYFRERLDIVLGFFDSEGEFATLHYDSRRFEPYEATDVE